MARMRGCLHLLTRALLSYTGITGRCHRWRAGQGMQARDEAILARAREIPFASTAFAPRFPLLRAGDRNRAIAGRADALRRAGWSGLLLARDDARAALAALEVAELELAIEGDADGSGPAPAQAAIGDEIAKMKALFSDCDQLVALLERHEPTAPRVALSAVSPAPTALAAAAAAAPATVTATAATTTAPAAATALAAAAAATAATAEQPPTLWCPPTHSRRSWSTRQRHCIPVA